MQNVLKPTDVTQELVLSLQPGDSIFVECKGMDDVQRARMIVRTALARNPHSPVAKVKTESYATPDVVIMCRIDFIGKTEETAHSTPTTAEGKEVAL